MTEEHFQKWWQKITVALLAIIFWGVVIVVGVFLLQNCLTPPTHPCPPGMVWVQDPGSPFGDGDCE